MHPNEYPPQVTRYLSYFKKLKLWHIVTKNDESTSCREAANNRYRLGNKGIPIFDELKSNFGSFLANGEEQYVMVHCRGNQILDDLKLEQILKSKFQRLEPEELERLFGIGYGLVNPFIGFEHNNILQIFDVSIFDHYFPPYTMMTNLGHLRYGVEFKPEEIVDALSKTLISDVVFRDTRKIPIQHKIGILTGNSPESGILLWEKINDRIRNQPGIKFLGDISFPRVLVESIPEMGLSMELAFRENDIRSVVIEGVESLCKNGSTIVGIACNTTQYFSNDLTRLCKDYGATYVSIAESTYKYLKDRSVRSFDFLAIDYVSNFTRWSDFRNIFENFEVNIPSANDISRINELAFDVKKSVVTGNSINKLRDLINNSTKTETVLLALTELSILFASQKKSRSGKQFIDTLSILSEAIADLYIKDYLDVLGSASD